jgi:glutamate synthase domain-containing protein 3
MVVGVSGVRDYFCEFHPDMKGRVVVLKQTGGQNVSQITQL